MSPSPRFAPRDGLRAWERAEVARSAAEAAQAGDQWLHLHQSDVERYDSPSAETPYPLEYAYHLLGDVQGRIVVDFGCGDGENLPHLCRRGAHVIAVDISEALLRRARRRLTVNGITGRALLTAASAHDLPLQGASVDVVFGAAILHHLDLASVAREIRRVLKAGGRAIFQEPVRNSTLLRWTRRLIPYRPPDVSPYERPLTDEELRAFGDAAGLRLRRTRGFNLPHMQVAQVVPALARRLDVLYRIDAALLRRAPFLQPYAALRVSEWVG